MKPIIRFRQYNKEWCPFKLNTILVPSNEKNTKGLYSKNDVLSVSGEAGIVNQIAFQGRSFAGASVLNYGVVNTNDIVYTKSPLRNNPYGIIKTNNGPSGIVSTLYAIYNCCEESCPQFVDTYFTSSSRTNNYLRPLVRKGAKNDMKVSSEGALQGNVIFPYKDEQIEIASYFRTLDAKLQASAKKVDSLKKLKSASLVAMFPQQGKTTPKVRFKGFEGEWIIKSFKELYKRSSIKNDLTYDSSKIISVANMYFKEDNMNTDEAYLLTYNVMKLGDIAFEGNKSKSFAHGRFVENSIGNGIVSHVFVVFSPLNEDYDINFWKYYINNEQVMGSKLVRCTKSSTMMTDLVVDDFLKETILVPSLEEQQEVGRYFATLDRKIALETARLEKLKQIKLACLDKMFV